MIMKIEIDTFLSKEEKVADYRQGLLLLKRSGFLDLVRRLGFPNVINSGSDLNAMAHEGSWSNGFQTGINQLEYFELLYANKAEPGKAVVSPTFGGAAIAKKEGYLTETEIRNLTTKGKKQ